MTSTLDRIKGHLDNIVRSVVSDVAVDYKAFYPSKILKQNGDGSLDLKPDDPRIPGCSNVPLRGLPGIAVKLSGGRALLGFEGSDPSKPIAALFEITGLTTIYIGGSDVTGADVANFVALANLTLDRINTLQSAHDTHTHQVTTAGAPTAHTGTAFPVTSPIGALASVAATKVKAL